MRSFRATRLAVLCLLVTGLFAALPAVAFADRTIGISQGVFEITLPPGGTYTGEFLGENVGTEPLNKVYIYTTDIIYDSQGNATYEPVTKAISADANKLRRSAAAWTQLKLPVNIQTDYNAAWVPLAPGEKIPVGFTIKVPANAAPGDYNAAIFLEMGADEASASAGTGSVVAGRIGSRLRIRVTGDVKMDFRFTMPPLPGLVWGQNLPLAAHFDNQGNIDVKVTGNLSFKQGGTKVQSFNMGNFQEFYLPAAGQMDDARTLTLNSWWPGPRDVVYHVSYLDETISKQVSDEKGGTVFFVPWQFLAILGIGIALLTGGLLVRSSLASRRKKAEAAREERDAAIKAQEEKDSLDAAAARQAEEDAAATSRRRTPHRRRGDPPTVLS